MCEHKWRHADTYRPYNRSVFVDVFLCDKEFKKTGRTHVLKGERKEFDLGPGGRVKKRYSSQDILFPMDRNFKVDWEFDHGK